MLYQVIQAVSEEINDYLRYNFDQTEDVLILSNLVDLSGAKALQTENQIHLQLVRIEEDKTINRSGGYRGLAVESAPRLFHTYLLFSANFSGKQYQTGLKYISKLLEFIVANPTFNSSNISNLPDFIDSIAVEIQNLEERDLSNLWGAVGSKLLPHLYCKMSFISIVKSSERFEIKRPTVSGMGPNSAQK